MSSINYVSLQSLSILLWPSLGVDEIGGSPTCRAEGDTKPISVVCNIRCCAGFCHYATKRHDDIYDEDNVGDNILEGWLSWSVSARFFLVI